MPDLQPFENRSADHLRLVLESGQIGIWELELQSGLAVRNGTHDEIFGYDQPLASWSYGQFLDHVVDADRARVDDLQKTAIDESREWSFECQIRTFRGDIRWVRAAGCPLKDAEARIVKLIGHVIDITDSKESEARLRLITSELNHRVRNMLSMIKSLVRMSARGATDISQFARSLEGRVGALARTHQLLIAHSPDSMKPSAILEAELSAFRGYEGRFDIAVSDEAALSASASQGLSLIFHELVTNAVRYGALSVESGRVEVRIARSDGAVEVSWKECGGPPVSPDRTEGFGSVLIARALAADGTSELNFAPGGVECHIVLDVA